MSARPKGIFKGTNGLKLSESGIGRGSQGLQGGGIPIGFRWLVIDVDCGQEVITSEFKRAAPCCHAENGLP